MTEQDDNSELLAKLERSVFIYANAVIEAEIMPGEQPLRNVKVHYQTAENAARKLHLSERDLAGHLAAGFHQVADNLRESMPIAALLADIRGNTFLEYRDSLGEE